MACVSLYVSYNEKVYRYIPNSGLSFMEGFINIIYIKLGPKFCPLMGYLLEGVSPGSNVHILTAVPHSVLPHTFIPMFT